jgi:hypothetical protein
MLITRPASRETASHSDRKDPAMRLVSAATAVLVSGTVLALSGCFPPPNYGYPQPGMYQYQQPIQTLEPGGTYVPGGSGTYVPGTSIQSSPPGSGSLTPLDGGNAPAYSGSSTQSPLVPNPPAAGSPYYGTSNSSQTFENPTTPSQQYDPPAASNPSSNPFPAGTSEINFEGYTPPAMLEVRNGPQLYPAMTVAYEPDVRDDASLSITAHHVERPVRDAEPAFDHDREEFTWLRGVVSFDETDSSWNIVYSDAPESSDPYAGFLTLLDHPDFESLQDGTEVIVYGAVDPVLTDSTGRPQYVVTRIVPVEG